MLREIPILLPTDNCEGCIFEDYEDCVNGKVCFLGYKYSKDKVPKQCMEEKIIKP